MYTRVRYNKSVLATVATLGIATITVYLGWRFQQLPLFALLHLTKGYMWVLSVLAAFSLVSFAAWRRGFVLGVVMYLGGFYALCDVLRFFVRLSGSEALLGAWGAIYGGGMLPILLTALICIGGYYNAKSIRVKRYSLSLERPAPQGKTLRVAMFSDMHLGTTIKEEDLPSIAERVNALEPDIILLCGDIYEEHTTPDQLAESIAAFRGLKSRLGTYCVLGNHEYAAEKRGMLSVNQIRAALRTAGVRELCNERVLLDGEFYLVGRNDSAGKRSGFSELLGGAEERYPVIMMDHKPEQTRLAAESGVDVQFSGHTHAGQLAPISSRVASWYGHSDIMYGHRRQGSGHTLVTSGIGTWGFPMRIGSRSEILLAEIQY